MRRLLALGLAGLVALGVLKAGAVVFVGLNLGIPPALVSLAAALWITAPPTAAWLFARRRAAARAVPR